MIKNKTTLDVHSDWDALQTYALSQTAQRYYVIIGLGILLFFSVWYAVKQMRYLRDIDLEAELEKNYPGPRPTTPDGRNKRKQQLDDFRNKKWKLIRSRLYRFVTLGLFVPSTSFFFVSLYYGWFDSNSIPFVDSMSGEQLTYGSPSQIFIFVVDQFAKGAIMDILEVFRIDIGILTNNPQDIYFTVIVLAYRLFIGVFTATILLFLYRAFRAISRIGLESEI